jgi:hypothetical protein
MNCCCVFDRLAEKYPVESGLHVRRGSFSSCLLHVNDSWAWDESPSCRARQGSERTAQGGRDAHGEITSCRANHGPRYKAAAGRADGIRGFCSVAICLSWSSSQRRVAFQGHLLDPRSPDKSTPGTMMSTLRRSGVPMMPSRGASLLSGLLTLLLAATSPATAREYSYNGLAVTPQMGWGEFTI